MAPIHPSLQGTPNTNPRKPHSNIPSSSSMDNSSHNHVLNSIRSGPGLWTWLQESLTVDHRHERIAAGVMSTGIAMMTREMMEMHIQQAPEIRGILDYLPTARPEELSFGRKFRTWPVSDKQQTLRQRLGTWPLTKTEALLAKQYPVQGK